MFDQLSYIYFIYNDILSARFPVDKKQCNWTNVEIEIKIQFQGLGAGIAQLVVCWAGCPAWCSVMGLIVLWGEFFQQKDFFPLELTWDLTPFPQNSFGFEYKPRSSLCIHAFQLTGSRDPDIYVLEGWMLATKTHPACTIHKDGIWLLQLLDSKSGHIRKNLTQNGEPQTYSWGTQKKKNFKG